MGYQKVGSMARCLAAACLMAMATAAPAHGEGTTQPADGASLAEPPETIAVAFEAPTTVTNLKVTGPDGAVELASPPTPKPTKSVQIEPAEPLGPGEYTVQWRAIGSDGHAFKGKMSFTVED
jgi:methionine-rich copper-binding protein CopC